MSQGGHMSDLVSILCIELGRLSGLAVWGRMGVCGPHPPDRLVASFLRPGTPLICHFLSRISAPLNWARYCQVLSRALTRTLGPGCLWAPGPGPLWVPEPGW